MADSEETISLLMVGRNGNGKSSTGNTIFNSEVFKTYAPNSISNEAVGFHDGTVGGTGGCVRLSLVDGTCVGDKVGDITGGEEAVLESLSSIWRYELEFHAILFVVKFGVRFTKQEIEAVQCVKSMFGKDVFKKWGIIVMTYGDNFEKESTERKTFEDWCREQSGDFKSLIEECNYRCVLFNNRSYSDDYWLKLRSAISKIQSPPYTKFNFNACSASRNNYFRKRGYNRQSSPTSETSPLLRDRESSIHVTISCEANSEVAPDNPRNFRQWTRNSRAILLKGLYLPTAVLVFLLLVFMNINWIICKRYFCLL